MVINPAIVNWWYFLSCKVAVLCYQLSMHACIYGATFGWYDRNSVPGRGDSRNIFLEREFNYSA
jgi:hypothetical protein